MTKKDYELIASVFSAQLKDIADFKAVNEYPDDEQKAVDETIELLIDTMVNALATTNKKFDRDKFLKACGVTA